MARAHGARAQLLGLAEAAYGVAPGGDFRRLPFVSASFGKSQGHQDNDVIGLGRDPAEPIRDVVEVAGDIVAPVDVRNIGFWLTALLGPPVTTGLGPYTHGFASGVTDLPSLALELGHPEVPAFFLSLGVRLNSMALSFQPSGAANATLSLIGQSEARNAASQGGTPESHPFRRFHQFQGSVAKDGAPLGAVTSASLTYSNNLDPVRVIRDDGQIDGVDPTVASLTGTLEVRFADTVLLAAAEAGTTVALAFAYTIDADTRLVLTVNEAKLSKPRNQVSGPGGVQASYDWRGFKDASAAMLTVTLENDVADY